MKKNESIRVGILTISDRCSRNERVDESGPALRRGVEGKGWTVKAARIVADEVGEISDVLIDWSDRLKLAVILTTGGTGLGPRDVTPEATRAVIEKEIPGMSELMRSKGLEHTFLAPLSRAVVGIRGETLIVNFPGSPAGASQSLDSIADLVPHALDMLAGHHHEEAEAHAHRG